MSVAADFAPGSDPLYDAVLALLKVAKEQGKRITRVKLAKLLYLIDMESVSAGAPPVSGATWRWQDYGPFDNDLYGVEDQLKWSGLITRHDGRFQQVVHGSVVLALADDVDDPLPPTSMAVIRGVMQEHGAKNATALKDLSYKTPPMIEAQAGGERGVLLDLGRARQAKKARALIERHRALRAEQPQFADDEGVGEVLVEEHAEMQPLRLRANARGLGDA